MKNPYQTNNLEMIPAKNRNRNLLSAASVLLRTIGGLGWIMSGCSWAIAVLVSFGDVAQAGHMPLWLLLVVAIVPAIMAVHLGVWVLPIPE